MNVNLSERFFVYLAGQILLIENTRASNPILGYYQDVTASTAADVGGKGESIHRWWVYLFFSALSASEQLHLSYAQ